MHSQNSRVFKGFQEAYEPCAHYDHQMTGSLELRQNDVHTIISSYTVF